MWADFVSFSVTGYEADPLEGCQVVLLLCVPSFGSGGVLVVVAITSDFLFC